MKLDDARRIFLQDYSNPATRRAYRAIIDPLVEYLGNLDLQAVTPAQVHEYTHTLAGKGLSPNTFTKHVKAIKRFFNYLIELELLEKNPAQRVKRQRRPSGIHRVRAASDQEVALLRMVFFGHTRNSALFAFLADTGCRVGGLATLRLADLDLDNCRAIVEEKFSKRRFVWFSDDCARLLRRWLAERPADPENPFVFPGDHDGHLGADTISQIIRRACKSADIRPLGAHAFRHRKGYQLADARVAPSVAQTALGHDDVHITLEHYYPNADLDRAEAAIRETHRIREEAPRIIDLRRLRSQ